MNGTLKCSPGSLIGTPIGSPNWVMMTCSVSPTRNAEAAAATRTASTIPTTRYLRFIGHLQRAMPAAGRRLVPRWLSAHRATAAAQGPVRRDRETAYFLLEAARAP